LHNGGRYHLILFLAESTARVSLLNVPPVLDDLTPFAIQGEAVASASSLQALTVTVDGGLFYTATWPGGAFTQTLWTTPDWTPTEGPHQVAVTLTTWSGDVAVDVADVIVDTLPPAISIAPTVLTTTQYHPPLLNLTGLVTDAASLPDVVWRVGGGDWRPAAVVSNNWTGGWYLPGDTPDGTPYAVTAQATDIAGHTALVTQTVIVDLTPPAPVTLTLHSAGGLLEPGATLREPSPVITLTWTASSDGSGIGGYQARWTAQTTATLSITPPAPTARPTAAIRTRPARGKRSGPTSPARTSTASSAPGPSARSTPTAPSPPTILIPWARRTCIAAGWQAAAVRWAWTGGSAAVRPPGPR
jgi:hypothetical protein